MTSLDGPRLPLSWGCSCRLIKASLMLPCCHPISEASRRTAHRAGDAANRPPSSSLARAGRVKEPSQQPKVVPEGR
jgi:hypothetical protein